MGSVVRLSITGAKTILVLLDILSSFLACEVTEEVLFPNTHHIDLHVTKLKHDTAPFHFLPNVPQLTVVCLNITLK